MTRIIVRHTRDAAGRVHHHEHDLSTREGIDHALRQLSDDDVLGVAREAHAGGVRWMAEQEWRRRQHAVLESRAATLRRESELAEAQRLGEIARKQRKRALKRGDAQEAARLERCSTRLRAFTEARTRGGEIRESIAGEQNEPSFARLIADLRSELGVQNSGHIVQTCAGPVMYGMVSPKQLQKNAAGVAAGVGYLNLLGGAWLRQVDSFGGDGDL